MGAGALVVSAARLHLGSQGDNREPEAGSRERGDRGWTFESMPSQ